MNMHHARRGAGGSLYPKSAICGAECPPRLFRSEHGVLEGVEDWVPRNGGSRTWSGPEGSSHK